LLSGRCPSTVFSDSIRSGRVEEMNLGANCDPIESLPLKMPPPVKISPEASVTPRTFSTFFSTPAGKLVAVLVSWVTGWRAVTTTAVPFSESLKIWSKALLIVSVRT
jgi:hypothetical protein